MTINYEICISSSITDQSMFIKIDQNENAENNRRLPSYATTVSLEALVLTDGWVLQSISLFNLSTDYESGVDVTCILQYYSSYL